MLSVLSKFLSLKTGWLSYSRTVWIFWSFIILLVLDLSVTIWISIYYTDIKDETRMPEFGLFNYSACTNNEEMVMLSTECDTPYYYHGKLTRCIIFYFTLLVTIMTSLFYNPSESEFKILEDRVINFAYSMRVISLFVYMDFTSKFINDKDRPGNLKIEYYTVDFTSETINTMVMIGSSYWVVINVIAGLSGIFHVKDKNKKHNNGDKDELVLNKEGMFTFMISTLVIIGNVFPYVYITSTKDVHILSFTDTRGPGLSSLSLSQYFIASCSVFEFVVMSYLKGSIDEEFYSEQNNISNDISKKLCCGFVDLNIKRSDVDVELTELKQKIEVKINPVINSGLSSVILPTNEKD